ncbi:MAG: prephenate dehydrogenase [Crocinitomicaceae bacterium]|nr:prephenate dehydrogenase [Crocinitomicaceae bacterium]
MIVGIIGLGLIGGSMGLDLRSLGSVQKVIGFDINSDHQECARRMKIVDHLVDLNELYRTSDIIILATPVNITERILPSVLDEVSEGQIVTDVGSSKGTICKLARNHENGHQFIAGHPIAGTEHSGPVYAKSGLFQNKTGIICPVGKIDKKALKKVVELYSLLGMSVEIMNPEEHDKHLAYVSHLSHISSFALGLTVLEIEKDEKKIFDLAGSGFASTVRLAKSSADMWNPIFRSNKENILVALGEYIEQLNIFKGLLEEDQFDELQNRMNQANEVERVLAGRLIVGA